MLGGWTVLEAADVRLMKAYPLTEQGLGDTTRTIDRVVVGVSAVGAGHPAHMLGGEGLIELLGLPKLRWYLGWSDELVAGEALAAGALVSAVVFVTMIKIWRATLVEIYAAYPLDQLMSDAEFAAMVGAKE